MAAGLAWPLGRPWRGRPAGHAPWTFRLDTEHRWSLAASGGEPVVTGAEVALSFSDGTVTRLSALQATRRFRLAGPQGGDGGWQVVGTVEGVEVSAQFLDGPPPRISVTARGLADPHRLDEIRFFDTHTAHIPALAGRASRARLWINGYQSSDPCRILTLDDAAAATSHWQLAVLTGSADRPMALAFGAADAGEGRFVIGEGCVVARSILGGRPVGVALPPAMGSLAIVPTAEPLAELGGLAGGGSAPLPGAVPAGWCTPRALAGSVTEADVLVALDAAGTRFGPRYFRILQLGDGFQRAAGDWDTNDRFPHGHRWLTDRIHAAGFLAGLWLAPFAVAARSGIPAAHPEWLLETPEGDALVVANRSDWGGPIYGLDAAQAAVQDFLRDLTRHAVTEWGYDCLRLDALDYATAGTRHDRRMSPAESCRAGIRSLREGAGPAFVAAARAPLQHAAGLVDGMRIGPDVDTSFPSVSSGVRAVALRSHLNGAAWLNDPDCLLVREPLTTEEARTWASVVALSGGIALDADRLEDLSPERIDILKRTMPVAPLKVRAFELAAAGDDERPPAWLLAQVRDDWWMLVMVNWEEAARTLAVSLADQGIRGPLAAYDVWADRRGGDVNGRVALSVPPHTATVLSLRRKRRSPFVLGSSRHVVQAAVDLADETWDPHRKVLAARATRLDDRPHALTIALPAGFRPRRARSEPDVGATLETAPDGASARLAFTAGSDEVRWEVTF
jgi:hypothetical protein